MTQFVANYGIWVVVGLVFLETAGGFFVPGETAFIVASALAGRGHGNIGWLIGGTIVAAVLGTTAGYALGRVFGRELLSRSARIDRLVRSPLERSQQLFARHGAKALYFGRFIPFVRATLGWMAGIVDMPWRRFLLWNVAGSASWAGAIGVASYYVGDAVERGVTVGAAAIVAVVLAFAGLHLLRRRLERA